MPTRYEQNLNRADERIDNLLSDTIIFIPDDLPDGEAPLEILGYIRQYGEDDEAYGSLLPGRIRWRCKISKSRISRMPRPTDLIESVKLEGRWAPSSDTVTEEGRYYTFDLERSSR